MQYLRSLIFYVCFIGWTVITAFVGVFLLPLPQSCTLRLGRIWSGGILAMLRGLVDIRYEVRGTIPSGPALIASKHQSSWETFMFPVLLGTPAYVLKRELTLIPLLGQCFRKAGHIAVDRSAGAKALRPMINQARAVAAEGRQIVIFPEGTRTAPGETGTYQPGVSALYLQLGLPVVPVAVNSGIYWPRRTIRKRPGTIVIAFLDPIEPGLRREPFATKLKDQIETATRELEREALSGETARSPTADRSDSALTH